VTPARFDAITSRYANLRVAIVGDFCLDRYLEIDPTKGESSIETGLPVYNVVNVRSQPGGAGTILNNLVAVGVAQIFPIGFAGEDGEGYELVRNLQARRGVDLRYFLTTPLRRTFTYCKPLIVERGKPPRELNRLDSKNWTETPPGVSEQIAANVDAVGSRVDALIVLDQVDLPGTGVITRDVLRSIAGQSFPDGEGKSGEVGRSHPLIIGDSRRGLSDFPPLIFKMNKAELAKLSGKEASSLSEVRGEAVTVAQKNQRPVFVTMAEEGILSADPSGNVEHVPAFPIRGEIDIVGAGDAVTANLACALAANASLREALELANAGASVVIHQLGTTGTADLSQLRTVAARGDCS
jgi:rfaE bifunctional protein kinase chain/domain